jgi:hypothetical protein
LTNASRRLPFVQEIHAMSEMSMILLENVAHGPEIVAARGDTATTTVRRGLPLFVPIRQLYYWSREWQNGENDALGDLEAGRFKTFPDGALAARWLLADEE